MAAGGGERGTVLLDCVEVGVGVSVELRDSPGWSVGSAEAVGALVAKLVALLDIVLVAVPDAVAVAISLLGIRGLERGLERGVCVAATELVTVIVADSVAVALLVALAELVAVADAVSVGRTDGEGGADAVAVTDGDTCNWVRPAL